MTINPALVDGIRGWLASLGLDPDAPSLADTPRRVVSAWEELTAGYGDDPAQHLKATFDVDRDPDGIIAVTGVAFTSICEHHLMPFTGSATVAYLPAPGAPVVGLSKLARLVDVYARRLQVQERLTREVVDALDAYLETRGAACRISAEHGCLTQRGAHKPGAAMVTTAATGLFRDDAAVRAELHQLGG